MSRENRRNARTKANKKKMTGGATPNETDPHRRSLRPCLNEPDSGPLLPVRDDPQLSLLGDLTDIHLLGRLAPTAGHHRRNAHRGWRSGVISSTAKARKKAKRKTSALEEENERQGRRQTKSLPSVRTEASSRVCLLVVSHSQDHPGVNGRVCSHDGRPLHRNTRTVT